MTKDNRTYIAIDLKSFFASVECAERGLDPLTTNLVVSSTRLIMEAVASLYDRIVNPDLLIRRLTLATNHVISEESIKKTSTAPVQLDLFTDYEALKAQQKAEEEAQAKERRMQEALLNIKSKFGKNSILRGLNFEEGATA